MEDSVTLNLNPDEQEAVAALQQEMGLENPEDVVHLLVRQAASERWWSAPVAAIRLARTTTMRPVASRVCLCCT